MADGSAIEWTDATWNPTTGCTKVSPGCAHCYIERTPAFRIAGRTFVNGAIPLELHANRLEQPLHWRKPRRVFVNSLSDLFHDDVPDAFIERVFSVMALAERHTFQVLTKRPARMRAWFQARRFDVKGYAILQSESGECVYAHPWPLPNVWLGVSVENQHFADERIPLLLQTPAAVRFISAEPLLGPIDLTHLPLPGHPADFDALRCYDDERDEPLFRGACLDWVIVGGESGPGARTFDAGWARSIVGQCRGAGVPVFVKQLGSHAFDIDGKDEMLGYLDLRDRKGGNPDEWPIDLRVREYPAVKKVPV